MDELNFIRAMAKGQQPREQAPTPENCSYCIFSAVNNNEVRTDAITGGEDRLLLELWYTGPRAPGYLRVRQMDTNVLVEESTPHLFLPYLEDKPVKYLGQLLMYAIQFKIENISAQIARCTDDMKAMEDDLDNCMDNSGTYRILDYRRTYTQYGDSILSLDHILARIDKGYYPIQMQNSYVLQGEVRLAFDHLEHRYELLKGTLIKDLDTYTSIINNNINRSDRTLSLISIIGLTLNFLFGSLLAINPLLGILGGVVIGGLSVGATLYYRTNRRNGLKGRLLRFLPAKKTAGLDVVVCHEPVETSAEQ